MLRFNDIADRVLECNPNADLELLQRAYIFTAKMHEGQERLSGEPYLVHPLEVAGILADMRLDEVTVTVGLLHDTVEDTLTTLDEIKRLFGEEVAFLVEGLTKLAKIEFNSRREREAENFRKMLLAMSKDIRILLVKLADRLHNMRTLQYMKEDSRRRIAQETQDIYVPLAHRLGVHWIKQELADHVFRELKPAAAAELEEKLKLNRKAREKYIQEVIEILSHRLGEAGLRAEVTGRVKELASIHHKMETQGLSLDQIYDVIAFRIILQGAPEQVYAVLGLVHGIWPPVAGRFKDYVAIPKPNGYQSLHTTVIGRYGERMEVQIRTEEMHRNAEFGIAAHWRYKEGRHDPDAEGDDSQFAWLRQLLEWQRDLKDPNEFLDVVKVDLFPDEVYIFTPKGTVINLPKGGTPVDFAYAIHTEVGDHCYGAKVNGKMAPLRQPLRDGDTVEILTSPTQLPSKDWLEFVVTGKARSRIRQAVRLAEQSRSQELGRSLLERELEKAGLSLEKVLEEGALQPYLDEKHRGAGEELFSKIGYGTLEAAEVIRFLKPDGGGAPSTRTDKLREFFRWGLVPSKASLQVSGLDDALVKFGQCCNPLPGDEIVGFMTRGEGVTIHLADCAKVFEQDRERRIDVQWDPKASIARNVQIRVLSQDRPGLLAAITNTISAAKINIVAARIETTPDQKAVHTFDIAISNLRSLNAVIKKIAKINGVLSVERVRK